MATTSPDNIYSPDAGQLYALTQDLLAMADSIQSALTGLRTQITALKTSTTPTGSRFIRTGSFAFPTSGEGPVAWDSSPVNSADFANSGGVLTCNRAGRYLILGQASMGALVSARGAAILRFNNSTNLGQSVGVSSGEGATSIQVQSLASFGVGDTVQLNVLSQAGVNIPADTSGGRNYLLLSRIF